MAAGPIGPLWQPGSWSDTCWEAGTWASVITPPTPVDTGAGRVSRFPPKPVLGPHVHARVRWEIPAVETHVTATVTAPRVMASLDWVAETVEMKGSLLAMPPAVRASIATTVDLPVFTVQMHARARKKNG